MLFSDVERRGKRQSPVINSSCNLTCVGITPVIDFLILLYRFVCKFLSYYLRGVRCMVRHRTTFWIQVSSGLGKGKIKESEIRISVLGFGLDICVQTGWSRKRISRRIAYFSRQNKRGEVLPRSSCNPRQISAVWGIAKALHSKYRPFIIITIFEMTAARNTASSIISAAGWGSCSREQTKNRYISRKIPVCTTSGDVQT